MEIEAKFTLPDVETVRRLEQLDSLCGYCLSSAEARRLHDTYLDTAGRRILAAGYACRRRQHDEGVEITLKQLSSADGATHRREEIELRLPEDRPRALWPLGPLTDRMNELVGETPLRPLFDLDQDRVSRHMTRDGESLAEMSLDHVHLRARAKEESFFELEVELQPAGTEDDLGHIVTCLQETWGLVPQTRSKFERARAFSQQAEGDDRQMEPRERAICECIAQRADMYARRALALLALDAGATQVEAAVRAGLSERRVRFWLAQFRSKRVGVFPNRVLTTAVQAPTPTRRDAPAIPEELDGVPTPTEPLPLEELLKRYRVDVGQAEKVAENALVLFDELGELHGLPAGRRSLLETAALVHDIGIQVNSERHHLTGRDILLAHPPTEADEAERTIVALTTFLHAKRVTRARLGDPGIPGLASMPDSVRAEALALAALLRVASGLDHSGTHTSQVGQVQRRGTDIFVTVSGPNADVDSGRAEKKADLWRRLYDTDMHFVPDEPTVVSETTAADGAPAEDAQPEPSAEPTEPPKTPGLLADDSMAEAGRKTLLLHLQHMIYHEQGTRLGKDIEELHDMRVATRRMRAAVRVFAPQMDIERLSPYLKDLKRTARVLGAVRDLDVFWEKTQRYLDDLPEDQRSGLAPLREVWQARRGVARQKMLQYLDGNRYRQFRDRFGEHLAKPGAVNLPPLSPDGEPLPNRLRELVPVAVFQRLAAVRSYDEWVTGPDVPLERLHLLRIAAKRLRYTLEFFQEVLGPEAKASISEVKALQDHLGDLQDAMVASGILRDYLTWGTWGHGEPSDKRYPTPVTIVAPGVAAYLAARQSELQRLISGFPQAWGPVRSRKFSQLVTSALAPLI